MKVKRLLIIDSHAVLHRAFHALPPLTSKKGELVNAVYGFLLVFFKAIKEFKPNFVVATFDLPGPTLRHKEFKKYKAKRPKMPDELSSQIPKIKNILQTFNVPIFEKQGFEADDLIGAIAEQTEQKQIFPKIETIILTGDLDALQLVNSQTKVYAMRRGLKDAVLYNTEKVKEKYQGLKPSQLLDFKGLRGDPSDNIPGVTGIGEKTAIKLLKEFKSFENLYKNLEKVNAPIRTKLEQYKEQAFLSKELARIRKEVPIDFELKKCSWPRFDKEKVIQLLEKFGFNSLIKRLSESTVEKQKIGKNLKLW